MKTSEVEVELEATPTLVPSPLVVLFLPRLKTQIFTFRK